MALFLPKKLTESRIFSVFLNSKIYIMKYRIILSTLFTLFVFANLNAQDSIVNYQDINGKKQGYWLKKSPEGIKLYEGTFKNDVPIGKFTKFHPNGKVKYDMYYNPENPSEVDVTMYDEVGELAAKGKYSNKEKDGLWTYYGENNIVIMEETYNKGKLQGKSIIYWQSNNHNPAEIKNWDNNIKHGDWLWFYDGGNKRMTAKYKEGKLDGDFIVYFIDGSIHVNGSYVMDKRNGKWDYYNEDGSLKASIEYNNGKIVNEDEYERAETARLNKQLENVPQQKDPEKFGEGEDTETVIDPDDPQNFLDNPEEFMFRDKGISAPSDQQQEDPKKSKKNKKKKE